MGTREPSTHLTGQQAGLPFASRLPIEGRLVRKSWVSMFEDGAAHISARFDNIRH